jgi:hypothetical protein
MVFQNQWIVRPVMAATIHLPRLKDFTERSLRQILEWEPTHVISGQNEIPGLSLVRNAISFLIAWMVIPIRIHLPEQPW